MTTEKNKIRVEIVLSESDADIIEIMEASGLPRATFFKRVAREYMQLRESVGADLEDVVKRAVREAFAQHVVHVTPIQTVEDTSVKNRLAFGAKKV